MNSTHRYITFVFLLLASCFTRIGHAEVMPSGFTQFRLGMTSREFLAVLKAMPNILTTSDQNGNAIKESMEVQAAFVTFKNSSFDLAFCSFDKDSLDAVVYIKKLITGDIRVAQNQFIDELLKRYGVPSSFAVVKGESLTESPAMIWRQSDALIVAATTQGVRGTLELKIKAGGKTELKSLYEMPVVSAAKAQELLGVIQSAVKTRTGNVSLQIPVEANTPKPKITVQKDISISYFAPTWTKDNLWPLMAFRVARSRVQSYNSKLSSKNREERPSFVLAGIADNSVTAIIQLPALMSYPAWNSALHQVSIANQEGVFIFDLDSKVIGRLSNGLRSFRTSPDWGPDNKFIVTSGTHADGSGEEDIFVTRVADKLGLVSGRDVKCIVALPGSDALPIWAPDGNTIIFCHQNSDDASNSSGPWSIYQVGTNLSYSDKNYQPPQKLAQLAAQPERFSMFSDGKRVLISYLDNEHVLKYPPQVLDIATKELRPLKWPVLHDPDLPNGQVLIPRELAVSPDANRIAFRALRWSGAMGDSGAICIYTCNLNGSDLQRVTPPTDMPMQEFKYPQPGITALNAWEKLQPQPNTRVLTDLKEADAEWQRRHRPDQAPSKNSIFAPTAARNKEQSAPP